MVEDKLDWQLSMKPADEKGKVSIDGYLKIPGRAEVNFTTKWTMKEFAHLVRNIKGSVEDFLAQIAGTEAEKKSDSPP
jgi:hypothetical protein